ncbi:MAG: protein kinase, partial [Planctomycetes bacterium]|nr:protein kinase [Planctomycetota bacterium]
MSEQKPPEPTPSSDGILEEVERQVESIAERYLDQLQAGQKPDRRALLAAHPEIAKELERRLVLVEIMYGVAQPAEQPSNVSGAAGPDAPSQPPPWLPGAGPSPPHDHSPLATHHSPASPERAIHLKCPHCGNRIQLVEPQPKEITCENCGSSFQLEPGTTTTYRPDRLPKSIGKFQVLELLGRGAFGAVYKGRDPELDRTVAIKVPRAGYFETPEQEERFLREARAAARLQHPGIVQVHEVAHERSVPYIVSDYIGGLTLADRLTGGRPSFRESAELVAQIGDALDYAHRQKVIHRDIKPSNILIDHAGHPHLTDFGLARRDEGEITVTLDGQILGTPAYMSPEQAGGDQRHVDGRTDVYSLGVILYELLTGE